MSAPVTPNDPKKFTVLAFTSFVVAFVFAMLMMLWHGDFTQLENGKMHYNTKIVEP
ncbi:MAG: hypothetical protein JST21_01500 [Bacteroidetes bacterium]|nr:hypothetical protein [Bacteroidota bacterium]